MPSLVIWMDGREAKIMKLTENGVENIPVKAHGPKHPDQPHGKQGQHSDHQKFYHELAEVLKHEDQTSRDWLLTGPGLAAEHFRAHLEKHHAHLLKHVVAVTKSDHPSSAELLKTAQKFFRKYELFEKN